MQPYILLKYDDHTFNYETDKMDISTDQIFLIRGD